jgi:hypothetical protein
MDDDSRQWIKDNQVSCLLILILFVLGAIVFVGCLSLAV